MLYVPASVGDFSLILNTDNGHGSGSTSIRRLSVVQEDIGGPWSVGGSSVLGTVLTCVVPGVYAWVYTDLGTAGGASCRSKSSLKRRSSTGARASSSRRL